MEKTEVVAERSGFGKMLPPKLPLDKIKLQIPKKWAFVKESILLSIGFLWGNTTVFQILNTMGIAYISAFLIVQHSPVRSFQIYSECYPVEYLRIRLGLVIDSKRPHIVYY